MALQPPRALAAAAAVAPAVAAEIVGRSAGAALRAE
jgi:hypothetical protein